MSLQDNLHRAQYSISSKDVQGLIPKTYGGKQLKGVDGVTGHISNSTLWLLNSKRNQIQTMVRLGVTKDGKKFLFDVYSEVIENAYDPAECTLKVAETTPSRTEHIKSLINDGYEILGWIDIKEIETQQIPSY